MQFIFKMLMMPPSFLDCTINLFYCKTEIFFKNTKNMPTKCLLKNYHLK